MFFVIADGNAFARKECGQPLDVLAGVASDLPQGRKFYPIGLRNIEDVGISESQQDALILLGNVLIGFGVLLPAHANDGGKDADAFLSGPHAAAKILPRPKSGNAGSGRHLPRNLQHVAEAVLVKATHGCEVARERFGVTDLQLLYQ